MERESRKLEIGKGGRNAMPFDGAGEAVNKGEEENMSQHFLSKERTCAKKEKQNMSLAKRFAQAFLKLDTWFESTKGLSAEEGRDINTQKN